MIWTQEARDYFFGTTVDTDLSEGVKETEEKKDTAFRDRYCSIRTARVIEAGNVELSQVRQALRFLSEKVPSGRHTSPGWDKPLSKKPLVAIGYAILQIRKPRPTVVLQDTCIGLYARGGQLFLWTDTKSLNEFCQLSDAYRAFKSEWRGWHAHKSLQSVPFNLHNQVELGSIPNSKKNILETFLQFIEKKISSRRETPSYVRLMQVLLSCREVLADPIEWEVIYPRLASYFDDHPRGDDTEVSDPSDPSDRTDLTDPTNPTNPTNPINPIEPKKILELALRVKRPTGRNATNSENATVNDLPIDFGTSKSMLEILRMVAIARVKTVLPKFDNQLLDEWILNTGGNSAHKDTAGLFFIYAASITNAGGPKPKFEQFGGLIRDAIKKPHIVGNRLNSVPKDIQALAQDCLQHLDHYALGGKFNEDIKSIAESGGGRILMCRLLTSVIAFAVWLQHNHAGTAKELHKKLMTAPGINAMAPVGNMLRDLQTLPQIGVATAANFLKDSQATGLQALKLNPRSAANHLAGWFAKPDLHVARLMAYITGRANQPGINPQNMVLGTALALFYAEPDLTFSSNYEALLHSDGPAVRVICDVHAWARACNTSALEIDRILYLIGVRETLVDGCLVQAPWYPKFVVTVDKAIRQGVQRKS